jgi:hypothetical protein
MLRSRHWLTILACWLALTLLADVRGDDPAKPAPAAPADKKPDVEKLIRQLGSDEFDVREGAQRILETLDENDLPVLRATAKKTTDAEVKRRLTDVIATLETRFTKDPYEFIERVGGKVVTYSGQKPVKTQPDDMVELSVILDDTNFGDADMDRLKGLGNVTLVSLDGTKVTDRGLHVLESLTELQSLSLDRTVVTDAGLAHLKGVKNLQALCLKETKIKGKGLDHLKDLTKLTVLILDGSDVRDGELAHAAVLTRLIILSLDRTKVTNAGLAHLCTLPELQSIFLEKTAVTDTGLDHLARIKKLYKVYLAGTHVTAKGVADLKKVRPDLDIDVQEMFDK